MAICWLLFSSFTFYVTFVQYALLRRAELILGLAESDLTPGFGLLAACGIAGSLIAGWLIDRRRPHTDELAQVAAVLSGILAGLAIMFMQIYNYYLLLALFAPLGLALGLLIVVLLTLLVTRVPLRVLGIFAGLTTGAIYFVSSVLAIFSDQPDKIALFDTALIVGNIVVVFLFLGALKDTSPLAVGRETDLAPLVLRLWPLALVVLVDTALFVLVSRAPGDTPILATGGDWIKNGAAHFLAATVVGTLYARLGWRRLTYVAATALALLVGAFIVHRLGLADLGGPIIGLYSAVVGVYTVALFTVFGEETPRHKPAMGIALGMVLVGWVASPLGIILGTALLG